MRVIFPLRAFTRTKGIRQQVTDLANQIKIANWHFRFWNGSLIGTQATIPEPEMSNSYFFPNIFIPLQDWNIKCDLRMFWKNSSLGVLGGDSPRVQLAAGRRCHCWRRALCFAPGRCRDAQDPGPTPPRLFQAPMDECAEIACGSLLWLRSWGATSSFVNRGIETRAQIFQPCHCPLGAVLTIMLLLP